MKILFAGFSLYLGEVQGDRSWRDRALWLLATVGAACATGPSVGSSTPRGHASHPPNEGVGHFRDWNGLIKTLAATAESCVATSQDREGGSTAILLPVACLFGGAGTTVNEGSSPVVTAIASELTSAVDREFWIAVHASAISSNERVNRARAGAVVNALIAAGVAPERLAAVVGFTAQDPNPAVVAEAAVIEIVASPLPAIAFPRVPSGSGQTTFGH